MNLTVTSLAGACANGLPSELHPSGAIRWPGEEDDEGSEEDEE